MVVCSAVKAAACRLHGHRVASHRVALPHSERAKPCSPSMYVYVRTYMCVCAERDRTPIWNRVSRKIRDEVEHFVIILDMYIPQNLVLHFYRRRIVISRFLFSQYMLHIAVSYLKALLLLNVLTLEKSNILKVIKYNDNIK